MNISSAFAVRVLILLAFATSTTWAQTRVLSAVGSGDALRYGFRDADSSWAIRPEFEGAGIFVDRLAPVKRGGRWAFIRPDGSVARELPGWEDVGALHGGLAWVGRGMQYGYIDSAGALRIPVVYDAASDFNLYNVGAARVMPAGSFSYITIDNPLLERAVAIRQEPLRIDARFNGRIDYQLGAAAYRRGDFAECRSCLLKAAALRNPEALSLLGACHYLAKGGPKAVDSAIRYWRMAGHRGEPNALYNLGMLADRGEGMPRDYALAAFYYSQAAASGHVNALNNLGVLYANGTGRPKDATRAADLFEQAANRGSASSAFFLAQDLAYGQGRTMNRDEARMWFRIAAERGHPDAAAASYAMDHPQPQGRYNKDFMNDPTLQDENNQDGRAQSGRASRERTPVTFSIPQPTYAERLQEASNRRYQEGVEKQLRDEERFNRQFRR